MGLLDQLFAGGLQAAPQDWAQQMQGQMQSGMISPSPTNYGAANAMPGAAPPQAGERKMFPAPDAPQEDSAPMRLGGMAEAAGGGGFAPPSAGTSFRGALRGFARGGLLGALGGAMDAEDEVSKQNALYQTLTQNGVPQQTASMLIKHPEAYKVVEALKTKQQSTERTNQTAAFLAKKYQLDPVQAQAVAQDPELLRKYLAPNGPGSGTEFGTTVIWGKDGKAYFGGKDGSLKEIDADLLPPDELARMKAGGAFSGKTVAEAKAALPGVVERSGNILAQLETLEKDPYLDSMLGNVQGRQPNWSSDAERVQSKMNQVTGSAFLTAFNMLKGGGAITEKEGEAATASVTRLQNVRVDEASYREAIEDLKKIARNSVIRSQIEAGIRPPEDVKLLHDYESFGIDPTVSKPEGEDPNLAQVEVGAPTAEYAEPVQPQGGNPRAPGYRAGAGTPTAPNRNNPRAPAFKPGKTLDFGGGWTVKKGP